MTHTIDPNPVLVEYYRKAREFETADLLSSKVEDGEWLYIQSSLDQNIFLMKRLDELALIPSSGIACDCGIGLGTAIFDIFLQSKEIGKNFRFRGIEKQRRYLDFLSDELLGFWEGNLEMIEGDLMDQEYSDCDIIYCYTPFRDLHKLEDFYRKVSAEMKEGTILIENKNYGLGMAGILSSINDLTPIDLDGLVVFQKRKSA